MIQKLLLNTQMIWMIFIEKKDNFNKLRLIIHQILTFKTLWIFIKHLLQNLIPFLLLILASDNSLRFRKNLLERI